MEPGGQFDLQALMRQAQELLSAQQELAESEVTGTAGGGLVSATVNGQGEVTGLSIDPKAIDPDDPAETAETLADLVLAAIRDAGRAVEELQRTRMGPLAAGLGGDLSGLPGLPGMPGAGEGMPAGIPGLPNFPGLQGPPRSGGAGDANGDDEPDGPGGPERRPGTSGT